MTDKHVHDCTGPNMTCACGWKFTVPPVWVSIEIGERKNILVNDCFNTSTIDGAIEALKRAIQKLEAVAYSSEGTR